MPNLGFPEIIVILVIVLLLFGPKKLPELAKGIGQSVREFRKGTQGLKDELEGSLKDDPKPVSAPIQTAPVHTAQVHSTPEETIIITPSSVTTQKAVQE